MKLLATLFGLISLLSFATAGVVTFHPDPNHVGVDREQVGAAATSTSTSTSKNPTLVERGTVTFTYESPAPRICDSIKDPAKAAGDQFLKADCQDIIDTNKIIPGFYSIKGFAATTWATIQIKQTCSIKVKTDYEQGVWEVGSQDINDAIAAAMKLYSDPKVMRPVSGRAECDSRGNPQITWAVGDPK